MNSTKSRVEAGDQHGQVCIPPEENDDYSLACNKASLPVDEPSKVQDYVLEGTRIEFTNGFKNGPGEYCSQKHYYSAVAGSLIGLYTFAYCGEGIDRQGCDDCLLGAAEAIKRFCLDSYGAQASSNKCCIRYDGGKFCEFS
ncbi:hypothetical protein LINPERHAP1_LOCUS31960 [Linum perenne]